MIVIIFTALQHKYSGNVPVVEFISTETLNFVIQ